jgi:hypothetical protein|tara:strand:- start:1769 stop:2035 length:267 start_codon:yes stop_codon:yes gene_type:complete
MSGATAAEFAKWTSMARKCTDDELAFVIQDCREAGEAMRGWNPEKENYYADQRMTYSDEMRRRQKRDPFAFAKFFKDGVFVGSVQERG